MDFLYYKQLELQTHYLDVPYLKEKRRIRVLLPQDYQSELANSYPVIYMHDGQNIFYSKESYSGYSWKLIPTLKHKFKSKVIIVGIDNNNEGRLDEYGPWEFDNEPYGGLGYEYAKWVVEEVKPFIDKTYRTLKTKEHTALAGSSMGAIITAYMGSLYPDVFGSLGIFSLASWLSEKQFIDFINNNPLNKTTKVFIQVGTEEGNDVDRSLSKLNINQAYIDSSLNYYQSLLRNHHPVDNIKLKIMHNETHYEKYWAKHFIDFLKFISN